MEDYSLELECFRLGRELAEMQSCAELNMLGSDIDFKTMTTPIVQKKHENIIKHTDIILNHLAENEGELEEINKMRKVQLRYLDHSLRLISRELAGSKRQKMVEQYHLSDSEDKFRGEKKIFSELKSISIYRATVHCHVSGMLKDKFSKFRNFFNLGEILGSVIYATFSVRANKNYGNLKYYRTLNQDLRPLALEISDSYSFFREEDFVIAGNNTCACHRNTSVLIKTIEERLKQPVGGYLDIIVDKSERKVMRNGETIVLEVRHFAPFLLLFKNEEDYVSNRGISVAVYKNDKGVSDNVVHKIISELRKLLPPIGVEIDNKRNVGYRLLSGPEGA